MAAIKAKGAMLAESGIVNLSELVAGIVGVARLVLEAVQEMLLRVALQTARDDYEDRRERQRQGSRSRSEKGGIPGARQTKHSTNRLSPCPRQA